MGGWGGIGIGRRLLGWNMIRDIWRSIDKRKKKEDWIKMEKWSEKIEIKIKINEEKWKRKGIEGDDKEIRKEIFVGWGSDEGMRKRRIEIRSRSKKRKRNGRWDEGRLSIERSGGGCRKSSSEGGRKWGKNGDR